MGHVKKAVKKKATKKNGHNGTAALTRFQEALGIIRNTGEGYVGLLESIHPKKENITQQQMESAMVLDEIIESAKTARNKFDEEALTHFSLDGRFEHGRVAVTFPISKGRRNTKWKNVATDKARELAEEQGENFSADNFEVEVKDDTDYTTVGEDKTTVKLTASAG